MYTGTLGIFSNREDWFKDDVFFLIDEKDGSEVNLVGAFVECYVTRCETPDVAVLSATTENGRITFPSQTSFEVSFSKDDVSHLCEGTYRAFIRVTIGDERKQLVAGEVQVVHGGP